MPMLPLILQQKQYKDLLTFVVCIVGVIFLDQLSKHAIVDFFVIAPYQYKVTNFFNLVLTYNQGASFGFLSGYTWSNTFFIITAIIMILGITYYYLLNISLINSVIFGCIIGGAIGNFIDRFLYIGVVDFLDFHAFGYHFPAFNIADSAIVISVLLFLILPQKEC